MLIQIDKNLKMIYNFWLGIVKHGLDYYFQRTQKMTLTHKRFSEIK